MGPAVRVERTGSLLAADVQTARSLWARFRGLMGRRAIAPGEGLWLPADTSIHMLCMRFAIDAVFLAPAEDEALGIASRDGPWHGDRTSPAGSRRQPRLAPSRWRVVAIRERLRPWTGVVWYVRGAQGCLELEAGAAAKAGLRVGDVVRFVPAADGVPPPPLSGGDERRR
jgi:uncharacterized membrane protein (UPF0127 family)